MITITPATDTDIIEALDHLSDISKAELAAVGLDRGHTLAAARDYLRRGEAVTARADGEVVCVFGVFSNEGFNRTWFLATDTYFRLGALAVLRTRKQLKSMAKRHAPMFSITRSEHPDTMRWFMALGYQFMGSALTVHERVFRYA